jgi:hypothetical protein
LIAGIWLLLAILVIACGYQVANLISHLIR